MTSFLKHVENQELILGSPDSKETDGLASTLPLIAKLSIFPFASNSYEATLKEAASILSSNEFAWHHTLAAARLLSHTILNDDDVDLSINTVTRLLTDAGACSEEILSAIEDVRASIENREGYVDAAERFGKACPNPGSFKGALLAIVTSAEGGFCDAVRRVIRGGGCNCSRANFVGGVLGAAYGIKTGQSGADDPRGIPLEWIEKTDVGAEVFKRAIDAFL